MTYGVIAGETGGQQYTENTWYGIHWESTSTRLAWLSTPRCPGPRTFLIVSRGGLADNSGWGRTNKFVLEHLSRADRRVVTGPFGIPP